MVYIEDLDEFDGTYVDINTSAPYELYNYTEIATYMRENDLEFKQMTKMKSSNLEQNNLMLIQSEGQYALKCFLLFIS